MNCPYIDKKECVIPVPDELLKELKTKRKHNGFVFPAKDGTPRKNNLRRDFLRAGEKAGLEKRIHPHLLRHTYGSHLAMAGVDLPTIRDLMGHSSIITTMIYAHLHPDHLKKAVNKLQF